MCSRTRTSGMLRSGTRRGDTVARTLTMGEGSPSTSVYWLTSTTVEEFSVGFICSTDGTVARVE